MVNQIGTAADTEISRKQLYVLRSYLPCLAAATSSGNILISSFLFFRNEIRDTTSLLAKDTNNYIRELSSLMHPDQVSIPSLWYDILVIPVYLKAIILSLQRQKRTFRAKLIDDFSNVLKNFEVVQRTIVQKQQESVSRARMNSSGSAAVSSNAADLIDLQSPSGSIPAMDRSSQQAQLMMEQDADDQMLQQRCDDITKLKKDMQGLTVIFRELERYALDQGEVVSSIESNVVNAAHNVESGVQQLDQSRALQVGYLNELP